MAKLGARGERLKAKYAEARAAGFSSKDAMRLRTYSDEKFNAAVGKGKLEAPQEKYRARAKIRYNEREFKYSKARLKELLNFELTDANIKKLVDDLPRLYKQGYIYFYVRVTAYFSDGTSQTFQSKMSPVKDIINPEQLKDLIKTITKELTSKYPPAGGITIIDIVTDIMFWNPNSKGE